MGLGGWSLSQEHSHLMGRQILVMDTYRRNIRLFKFLVAMLNIPTVSPLSYQT